MTFHYDRAGSEPRPHIWLTLEAPEIIELKQIVLDQDAEAAAGFFRRVILPRVLKTAGARGLLPDRNEVIIDERDE